MNFLEPIDFTDSSPDSAPNYPPNSLEGMFVRKFGFDPNSNSGKSLLNRYGMRTNKSGVTLYKQRAMKKALEFKQSAH